MNDITTKPDTTTDYLVTSDFDQTLSFNDSVYALAEMLGISDFEVKVTGLSRSNLVQPGAELTYLLRHDPAFRTVRREHLIEAGKRVRLKDNVKLFAEILSEGLDGNRFQFFVISAGPREVVYSALEDIVPPENVYATELEFDIETGEICSVQRVPAGYGKVAVLQKLELKLQISPDRVIYVGNGSSDLYVVHDVNSRDGHTIAVSETKPSAVSPTGPCSATVQSACWCQFLRMSSSGIHIRFVNCLLCTVWHFMIGTKFILIGLRSTIELRVFGT